MPPLNVPVLVAFLFAVEGHFLALVLDQEQRQQASACVGLRIVAG